MFKYVVAILVLLAISSFSAAALVPTLEDGSFESTGWTTWRLYGPGLGHAWGAGGVDGNNFTYYVQNDPGNGDWVSDRGLDTFFNMPDVPAGSDGQTVELEFWVLQNVPGNYGVCVSFAEFINNATWAGVASGRANIYNNVPTTWTKYTAQYTIVNPATNNLNVSFQILTPDGATFAPGNIAIDGVQFVPEPATMSILGIGGVFALINRKKKA